VFGVVECIGVSGMVDISDELKQKVMALELVHHGRKYVLDVKVKIDF
jgi:hypothetical protein